MTIDLKANRTKLTKGTFLCYGESGTGKTEFAATFEKPLFLSDTSEGGWVTIEGMDNAKFFDGKTLPVVEEVTTSTDVLRCIKNYTPRIMKGEFKTLVVDSLTFYGDSYLKQLSEKTDYKDGRQLYQAFGNHIRYLMIELHKLPCHVVWLCLAKEPAESSDVGGILLPGKSAKTAPARCSYWLYHRVIHDQGDGDPVFEIHTKQCGRYPARVRGAPASMPAIVPGSTFKDFAKCIGKEV